MLLLKYIIICCLIFFIYFINKNKENYDARISNVNFLSKCGNMCSSVYGCGGFAYNDKLDKCYLSKFPITSPPLPSLYSDEFTTNNFYCNKLFPINTDYSINTDMYVDNKVYDCYKNKAEFIGQKYFDMDGSEKTIFMNDIYSLKSSPYNINTLIWPREKTDIQFDSKFNLIYDRNKIGYDADQLNEYEGEYLNPSQCKTDTTLTDCLNKCTNNVNCVGVEYNTNFNNFSNVCCLKSTIEKKISRRKNKENGIFYRKKYLASP
jgi:hypothetical protein